MGEAIKKRKFLQNKSRLLKKLKYIFMCTVLLKNDA